MSLTLSRCTPSAVWIVHAFSCRLHGLRRYEKALKDELEGAGR
jgi:hypothetical protein